VNIDLLVSDNDFTLILAFSHQGRRNYPWELLLNAPSIPSLFVGLKAFKKVGKFSPFREREIKKDLFAENSPLVPP